MTQEEKQKLIIALCGYLPYKCKGKYEIVRILESETKIERFDDELDSNVFDYDFEYENFKPYLRPMSSMTEKEKKEYKSFFEIGEYTCGGSLYGREYEYMGADSDDISQPISLIDWLNKHHFDYRDLIPMGLALEAPEGMYKTE